MKRCIITFTNIVDVTQVNQEMVLVDSAADKYDIHTCFEGRIMDGWIITGITTMSEGDMVYVLD